MRTQLKSRPVLLVDDHPLILDSLRATVGQVLPQAEIVQVGNGRSALASVDAADPRLVITDLNLPEMSGLELIRKLRAKGSKARLLVFAGEVDPWTLKEALSLGATGYVLKINGAECLLEAIQQVLAGNRFLCATAEAALGHTEAMAGSEDRAPAMAVLSRREQEILKLLALGHPTKAIASDLGLSAKTVETHRLNIQRKLHMDNAVLLTRYAIQHGLVSL